MSDAKGSRPSGRCNGQCCVRVWLSQITLYLEEKWRLWWAAWLLAAVGMTIGEPTCWLFLASFPICSPLACVTISSATRREPWLSLCFSDRVVVLSGFNRLGVGDNEPQSFLLGFHDPVPLLAPELRWMPDTPACETEMLTPIAQRCKSQVGKFFLTANGRKITRMRRSFKLGLLRRKGQVLNRILV